MTAGGPHNPEILDIQGQGFAVSGYGVKAQRAGDGVLVLAGNPRLASGGAGEALNPTGVVAHLAPILAAKGGGALPSLADDYCLVWLHGAERPRALLAVDRLGVGNAYWVRQGGRLYFATSLPLLAALPGLRLDVEAQALFDYVYFHMIPAPGSVYRDVARLMPGGILEVDRDRVRQRTHAATRFEDEHGHADFEGAKEEFRSLVEAGVRHAIGSSEDVGSFLSGGTDSSTVTGYLGKVTGRPATCFSIGFEQEGFDETEYARVAAEHFGADHHQYYVTPDDVIELIPRLAAAYGEPFGNSSVIPTYYCASLARENGIGVLLAGDGGDELFGGNERYARQKVFAQYDRLPVSLRRRVFEPLADNLRGTDAVLPLRKFRRFVEQARIPMPARMQSYNLVNWFGAENIFERDFLAHIDLERPERLQREVYDAAVAETMMNRMLAMDWKFTLADNDLRKVRTMSELAGVAVRYPLLDERLVDFSARLPVEWKVRRARLRWFFKEALRDFLPREILNKRKHGFGLPFGHWVLSHARLRQLAFDLMGDLRSRNIVRRDFLDRLCNDWIHDTPNYYGALVWLFMVLESWLAHAGDVQAGARAKLTGTNL